MCRGCMEEGTNVIVQEVDKWTDEGKNIGRMAAQSLIREEVFCTLMHLHRSISDSLR